MNTTASITTVTTSSQNPKQPQQRQTSKEIIAANVKELIAQLEAGHSNALTALATSSKSQDRGRTRRA